MSSVTKLFEETFYLGFEDLGLNKKLWEEDKLMYNNIFLRIDPDKITFHYLYSSDQIIIPKAYINLFLGIDRLIGDRLYDAETRMEKFLFTGTRVTQMIYGGDGSLLKTSLGLLIKLGSKDLRNLLKNKFGYIIEPIIFRNSQNTVEI